MYAIVLAIYHFCNLNWPGKERGVWVFPFRISSQQLPYTPSTVCWISPAVFFLYDESNMG